MAASAAHSQTPSDRPPLSRETIAEILVTRRQQLIRQMPQQIRISRGLTNDQREWVVDRATDFLVTQNQGVIADVDALERAFWKAADIRVHRTFEGRYETVRGRFRRVELDDDALTDDSASPEDLAVSTFERDTLEEFAAELTDEERAVLSVKYSGKKELGRFEIARILGRRPHEVRRAEGRCIASSRRLAQWLSRAGSVRTANPRSMPSPAGKPPSSTNAERTPTSSAARHAASSTTSSSPRSDPAGSRARSRRSSPPQQSTQSSAIALRGRSPPTGSHDPSATTPPSRPRSSHPRDGASPHSPEPSS
jgi:hypothetical protein